MRKSWKILNKLKIQGGALLVMVMLFACNPTGSSGTGDVLVRVYDKYLYASALEGIVPPGSSIRDSLTIVRTFIQNWVNKELIAKKAEENLPGELKDFSAQLKEYRNSLIIFEYEKMLLRQELDTSISDETVLAYYELNKNNFPLKRDIMDMQYVVLHTDAPAIPEFRKYICSELLEEKDSLALYSSKYAVTFSLLEDQWLSLDEMRAVIPLESYSYGQFNAHQRYFELSDSAYIYMLCIKDYKPADSIAPVQFVADEIRKIILNRRKNDLIRTMRQTVLQDAIEHNQVEIY
ncbi:MAG: hypothetical protein ABFS05_02390 [Bacteroidota bacterium]